MADSDDDDWFVPKRFGYGAGLPIAWQGWAVLVGYLLALYGSKVLLLPRHRVVWIVLFIVLTMALIAVAAQHTRGGWHWHWRGSDPD